MQEVTCLQCGHIVHITPDSVRRQICGEDLRRLVSSEDASHHFYTRAAEFAAGGDIQTALAEAQRGIAQHGSPELRLLAAILCKQMGHFDDMRHHVAAIPVDDALRGEAEWLLRSHQAQQRARRQEHKARRQSVDREAVEPSQPEFPADPLYPPDEALDESQRRRPRVWSVVASVLIVGALATVAFLALRTPGDGWTLPGFDRTVTEWNDPSGPDAAQAGSDLAAGAVLTATPDPAPAQLLPSPTPLLVPTVPPDVAEATSTPPQIADTSPNVPRTGASGVYDLVPYLIDAGYPELAGLDIRAYLVDGILTLEGIVSEAEQRVSLIEAVDLISVVSKVEAVELYVRTPATYTVQSGDTLWGITARFYGDSTRMDDIFLLNQDVMSTPSSLAVDMVLKLPPYDQ